MEYHIVRTGDINDLVKEVWRLLEDGWVPQGGIAVTSRDNGWPEQFLQAVVRKQEKR